MAGNGQTLGARISRWNTLVTNLEPDLPDMQHLVGDIAQLKEILRKSREFEAQQDDLRSQAQGTTATRKGLAVEGDRLRRRIGASLQWKHGFGSETPPQVRFPSSSPASAHEEARNAGRDERLPRSGLKILDPHA